MGSPRRVIGAGYACSFSLRFSAGECGLQLVPMSARTNIAVEEPATMFLTAFANTEMKLLRFQVAGLKNKS